MIHNLRMVCPRGHCFAAVAWNDAHNTQDLAASYLAAGADLLAHGGPIICQVCGSIEFHLEDVLTAYRSTAQAIPALTSAAIGEMRERDRLARTDDRN
jgi:hypothetical protein